MSSRCHQCLKRTTPFPSRPNCTQCFPNTCPKCCTSRPFVGHTVVPSHELRDLIYFIKVCHRQITNSRRSHRKCSFKKNDGMTIISIYTYRKFQ
ncbi:hypothetical protein ANCCAN_07551 [Ancylostoma caninum]|uniref:Uncharacterized protein n=1 Tax=Ancylostoma caninum TaxID=29170 RepID=A0A368GPS3_ANCCA|nr:hypothetical protein ANCCAN_07551 [Ancylostoma caninum]